MEAGAGARGAMASTPLAEADFAVVDVETTGLSFRKHRLLQVAVVGARADGTITDRWSSYVHLPFRWVRRLGPVHIHRIRRRDLKRAPELVEVLAEVARRTDGRVLTAHNLGFDRGFLTAGAHRSGLALTHGAEVCTLVLARRLDPERQWSHKLGALCERYSVPLERAHDALADAEATARLLPHLLAESGVETVGELVEFVAWRAPTPTDPTEELSRPPSTA